MLKIDLHVHTWYSDSTGSVKEVLEVAQRKGLDGIAITDHDTTQGAFEALHENTKLIIIPGLEIRTTQGEILGLGIKKQIPRNLSFHETLQRIHVQKALAIIPHPTLPFFSTIKERELMSLPIDGLEAFSSITPLSHYYSKKNIELAGHLNLPVTAGSDSHTPETVGDAFTIIDSESRGVNDILNAIKLGHTFIGGNSSAFKFKLKMLRSVFVHFSKYY